MLQTSKTDNSVNADTRPPESRSLVETLVEGVRFIRRHLAIVVLTCFVTTGAALVYLIAAVPTYLARAELVIDTKGAPGDAASVSTIVGSQIAIITSESVARAVIGKLGLAEDPEFAGREGVLRRMITSISRLLGGNVPETEPSPIQYAVESFDRKLSAKRIGFTYIVEITFESSDPERAAQILNTVAETHIMASMDAKYRSALRGEKWVKERMNELSSQASAAQKAVADYHKDRNYVASGETLDAGKPSSQLTDLRELEAAAESATKAYENFLRMLRYMDAMQQQSLPVFEARLLTEASRPFRPSWPKARIVLGVSMVGGILLGVGIGVLRDLSDRRMRGRVPVGRESDEISTHHNEQSPEQRRVLHRDEGRRERPKVI
jgi:uncharacterized protein involved in exopolysaccharide biosynthesis